MKKMKTKSIWNPPNNRFYIFLGYADKFEIEKKILIIGCSDGTYAIPSVLKGFKVTAIDIDKEAIYGGAPLTINNKKVEYLGLKKRVEIEDIDKDKIHYEVCDFMQYNSDQKFPLIFTSGSIHYACNSDYDTEQMINKMINFLDNKGVLLIEYIHKSKDTDKERHFVTKKEIENIVLKNKGVKIISHKLKKYIEEPNPRDDKVHEIIWGRIYIQKMVNKIII